MTFTSDATLLRASEANPVMRRRAEEFLLDAHGHGYRGTEGLQQYALWWNLVHPAPRQIDAITVHLAVTIEKQRAQGSRCHRFAHCPEAQRLWHQVNDTWDRYLDAAGPQDDGAGAEEWREHRQANDAYLDHRRGCAIESEVA